MLFLPHIMLIWDIPPRRQVLFYYVKLPFDRCVTVMWGNRCLFLISLYFFFAFWCRFICVTGRAQCLSCEAVWNSSLAATVVRNVLALSFFLTRLREPNTTWVVIKAAGCCLLLFFSPSLSLSLSCRDIFTCALSDRTQSRTPVRLHTFFLFSKTLLMINFSLLFIRTSIYCYLCAIVGAHSTLQRGGRAPNSIYLLFICQHFWRIIP